MEVSQNSAWKLKSLLSGAATHPLQEGVCPRCLSHTHPTISNKRPISLPGEWGYQSHLLTPVESHLQWLTECLQTRHLANLQQFKQCRCRRPKMHSNTRRPPNTCSETFCQVSIAESHLEGTKPPSLQLRSANLRTSLRNPAALYKMHSLCLCISYRKSCLPFIRLIGSLVRTQSGPSGPLGPLSCLQYLGCNILGVGVAGISKTRQECRSQENPLIQRSAHALRPCAVK